MRIGVIKVAVGATVRIVGGAVNIGDNVAGVGDNMDGGEVRVEVDGLTNTGAVIVGVRVGDTVAEKQPTK